MKKIFLVTFLIIFIPYIIVTLFVANNDIKFQFVSNNTIRVKRESKNSIETVPFEEYIVGVVAAEMPVSFELEALKAQAVAARTYALKKMERNTEQEYDIIDTVANQVYYDNDELKAKWQDDYTEKINKVKQAILATRGEYMVYGNEIIDAFFFSTSVGKTENSEEVFSAKLPYLRSVESSWDEEVSPVFNDQATFSLDEFYSLLGINYNDKVTVEITKTTSTGRIKELKINDKKMTGSDVYQKLGLRSTFFTISQNNKQITVNTKGYGHGVGMSQYGANGMAKNGYDYQKILKHYYQGIEIKKI
ncbi:MAG: stage II sporulation protein D [Bacilli bacterium]